MIDPNQTNINPATGRPYSFMDSMNDANGQLLYDPSQSDMWNLMNGRFRTQSDPAFGQITPQNQYQGGLMQQLVSTGQVAPPQQPQQPQQQYMPWSQPSQRVQNLPQPYGGQQGYQGGMGGNMMGPAYGAAGSNFSYTGGPLYGQGNYPQGMGNNGFGGGQPRPMGFDYSNPMNYSGYSNWNQPRQSSKPRGY